MCNISCVILCLLQLLMCRTQGQTNVALISEGSHCEASQPECERAFDGLRLRWAFFGLAQGNWINVTFDAKYRINTARFMQLGHADESNFKDLSLSFSDGSQQLFTLTIREVGYHGEGFSLNPPVETSFVLVNIMTAYTTGNTYNGFTEVEFYDGNSAVDLAGQTNVALTSEGSQCEASQNECEKAFDGVSLSSSNAYRWAFYGVAQSQWIKVTFNNPYTIHTARFMQLGFADESNFKDLRLTFSDGSQQQVTLTIRGIFYQWEQFAINPPVETTSVDVYILTAYTIGSSYNGFTEIEFYDGPLPSTTSFTTTEAATTLSTTAAATTRTLTTKLTTTTPAATGTTRTITANPIMTTVETGLVTKDITTEFPTVDTTVLDTTTSQTSVRASTVSQESQNTGLLTQGVLLTIILTTGVLVISLVIMAIVVFIVRSRKSKEKGGDNKTISTSGKTEMTAIETESRPPDAGYESLHGVSVPRTTGYVSIYDTLPIDEETS